MTFWSFSTGKDDSWLNPWLQPTGTATSTTTQRAATATSIAHYYDYYHEIPDEKLTVNLKPPGLLYQTAFQDATVLLRSPWYTPQKICKETSSKLLCCAQTVAISLHQDDSHIINTLDGIDMADVCIQKYPQHDKLHFFAATFQENPEIAECLQPGTIFHIDNHGNLLEYFFRHVRPNVTVPYILITSESDASTPFSSSIGEIASKDDLLIKWFGQSPRVVNMKGRPDKLIPFNLGLSKHHEQSRPLTRYLELTNFTNPFVKKRMRLLKWANQTASLSSSPSSDDVFFQSVFVKFNINQHSQQRQPMFENLCLEGKGAKHNKMDDISCSLNRTDSHNIYKASSRYMFGFSPEVSERTCVQS